MSDAIRWEAEITETAAAIGDDWMGEGCHLIRGVDVSEIAKDDPDPFFVEMTIMRAGRGTGKPTPKEYLDSAVEDCARLAPGLQAYLGHQDPKKRGREYRIPQAKVIAAKTEMQVDPATGKKVKVARAKAYVSRASQDLRTHIREGMAGPVSIDGRAVLRSRGDRVEVPKMLHLRAIDFCNPGTEGVKGAGVTAIVSEMDNDDDPNTGDSTMSDRLTNEGLLTQYGAEIREMNREAVDAAKAPLEAQVSEMQAKLDEATATIAERDGQITTLTDEKGELEARVTEMTTERDEAKAKADEATLSAYRDELVTEMKVIDSAGKRIKESIPLTVVEEDDADLTKSRAAMKTAAKTCHDDVAEMVKESGGGSIAAKDKGKGKKKIATDVTETTRSNGDEMGSEEKQSRLHAIFPNTKPETADA